MDPPSENVKKVGKFRYINKKKVSAGFFQHLPVFLRDPAQADLGKKTADPFFTVFKLSNFFHGF